MMRATLLIVLVSAGSALAQTSPSTGYPSSTPPSQAPATNEPSGPPYQAPMPAMSPPSAATSPDADSAAPPSFQGVWNGVGFGMTRDQVMAALPGSRSDGHNIQLNDTPVVGKCRAKATIEFGDKGVEKIVLKGAGSVAGRCSETVFDAMASKYGPPLAETGTRQSLYSRRGAIYIWNRPNGVTMRYKRYNDNGLGGGGLLQSSWELSYSTVGSDIAL